MELAGRDEILMLRAQERRDLAMRANANRKWGLCCQSLSAEQGSGNSEWWSRTSLAIIADIKLRFPIRECSS